MSDNYDRAIEIVLCSPAMLPHLDAFWAFIDGSMTEDEFRDAMSCDRAALSGQQDTTEPKDANAARSQVDDDRNGTDPTAGRERAGVVAMDGTVPMREGAPERSAEPLSRFDHDGVQRAWAEHVAAPQVAPEPERCPTCGSDDPKWVAVISEGRPRLPYCPNPWHSAPPEGEQR